MRTHLRFKRVADKARGPMCFKKAWIDVGGLRIATVKLGWKNLTHADAGMGGESSASGIVGPQRSHDRRAGTVAMDEGKAQGAASVRHSLTGQPAIFEDSEWFTVTHRDPNAPRRLWAVFGVEAWAHRWVSEMRNPHDFEVKKLLYP